MAQALQFNGSTKKNKGGKDMKPTKIIMFLIAWYATGFYITVLSGVETYRLEHQIPSSWAAQSGPRQ